MAAPYKSRTGTEGLVWFLIVMMGIAGQFGVMALAYPYQKQLQAWILAIAAIPFVIALGVGVWVGSRRKKKRIASIGKALSAQGLTMVEELDDRIRQHLRPHLDALDGPFGLSGGTANLSWVAFNEDVLIFEHTFITGSGRYSQEHWYTVVAYYGTAPSPPGARLGAEGPLWLNRMRFGQAGQLKRAHGEDIATGDEAFDKAWAVYGVRETADKFLTQEVRARLMRSRKGETWNLGNGWAACCFSGMFDAANMTAFIEHVRQTLSEI